MTSNEIRKKFLEYFHDRGHRVVKSSSLVPVNDPTLLFTNAGMNQFKDVFLGLEQRDYKCATSSQKCVRAGGKHNDLENVGHTRRHHTFFEMLGNFSFGDYFKKEAIEYAWELVTQVYGISPERLYVTIFGGREREVGAGQVLGSDRPSLIYWHGVGVAADRIVEMGAADNFWAMGETGPCGPCSEIHIDLGPGSSDEGHTDCTFPCECGRYVELWNLVFMQFNRDASGTLAPLPRPSIDTGMGLERMAAVLQGKSSNFETDLLWPLIEEAAEMSGTAYGEKSETDVSLRIIADHSRAAAFLIHDGVLPANDGRGYVLRKILRRAIRHGRMIGLDRPFLYQMTGKVAELMAEPYPELLESTERVAAVVKSEEVRFARSLLAGFEQFKRELRHSLKVVSKELRHMATQAEDSRFISELETLDNVEYLARRAAELMRQSNTIPVFNGQAAFYLYDTFGWPLDFIDDACRDLGFEVDTREFERAMTEQRARARVSWKGAEKQAAGPVYQSLSAGTFSVPLPQGGVQIPPPRHSEFIGYEQTKAEDCVVYGILQDGRSKFELRSGEEGEIILDRTPFYAEAGGQVGDTGELLNQAQNVVATVEDTYYPVSGVIAHKVRSRAPIRVGERVTAVVDAERRNAIRRNHTATHLLHAALRQVLGPHVKQAGSVVDPDRLRFDFSHFTSIDDAEIEEIERLANLEVLKNVCVETNVMELEQALQTGAMAFFGEKYSERVRVVSVPGFSKELCGGTHVSRTGDIGLIKITSEGGISAGVRRIEAVTGAGALKQFQAVTSMVQRAAEALKASPADLPETVEKLAESERALAKQLDALKLKLAQAQVADAESRARAVKDVKVLALRLDALDRSQMRSMADVLRQRLKSGVVVLGSASDGKVALIAALTPDLTKRLHAGRIAEAVAKKLGGTGGGRPDIAEAGGKNATMLDSVLDEVYEIVGAML